MDSLTKKVRKGLECHKDEIPGVCGKCPYFTESGFCSGRLAKDALKVLDSRDAMPVVRCKDCKYGEPWGVLIGCGTAKGFGITHNPDWYCADGERRTDDA